MPNTWTIAFAAAFALTACGGPNKPIDIPDPTKVVKDAADDVGEGVAGAPDDAAKAADDAGDTATDAANDVSGDKKDGDDKDAPKGD